MSVYRYRAINAQGRLVVGEILAASSGEARERLVSQSLLPRQVSRKLLSTNAGGSPQLLLFTQSLHTLLQAGCEFLPALSIAHNRMKAGPLSESVGRVISDIRAGHMPSEAFAKDINLYGPLWVAALKAGEASGELVQAIGAFEENLDRTLTLKRKTVAAVTYPLLVMVLIVVVVTVLVTVVVPKLTAGYASMGAELPLVTKLLMGLSKAMPWVVLLSALVAMLAAIGYRLRLSPVQRASLKNRILTSVPLLGSIRQDMQTVNFTAMLSLLLKSGLSVHESLSQMARMEGDADLQQRYQAASQAVEKGNGVTESFSRFSLLPESAMQMLQAGEHSGELQAILGRVSMFYKGSLDMSIQRFSTLAEPVLMLIMGLVVGFVMMAVYLPIFSMSQGLQ